MEECCSTLTTPRKNFIQLKLSHRAYNSIIPAPFRNSKRFLQLSPSNRPSKRSQSIPSRLVSPRSTGNTPRTRDLFDRNEPRLCRSISLDRRYSDPRETESTRLDDPSRFVEDATALQTVYHSATVHVYTHARPPLSSI